MNLRGVGLRALNQIDQHKCFELSLDDNDIYSIESIERFSELEKLSINNNPVFALKPLSGLKLTHLSLAHTKVKDLSHISGMNTLRVLDITGIAPNTFSSLKPLALEELRLTLKSSSSLAFLKEMQSLKKLVINGETYSAENGKLDILKKFFQTKNPTLSKAIKLVK